MYGSNDSIRFTPFLFLVPNSDFLNVYIYESGNALDEIDFLWNAATIAVLAKHTLNRKGPLITRA